MTPPPDAGVSSLSLEEQMRQLEGGGTGAPPSVGPTTPQTGAPSAGGSFEEHLRDLVMEIPGGIAGSISDIDGIGIASFTTDPDFPMTIADAEIASILNTFKKASQSLQAGIPQESFLVTDRYGIALKSVQNQYVVSVVIEANDLNWGLTRVQINKLVPFIEQELF
jgi:predicted regulator of Ras-like GTPase activity (Roadblock/LC7/MglB family)